VGSGTTMLVISTATTVTPTFATCTYPSPADSRPADKTRPGAGDSNSSASPAPPREIVVHLEVLDVGLLLYSDLLIDRTELLVRESFERRP
jgi:hypothetical protein